MPDDRRRPLRDDELARIAHAVDPDARATHCAPILGGLDAATYALDLEVEGDRRELVVRIFTLPQHRDGNAARRYWKAITGIPDDAPIPVPRPVHLDAEGGLVGLPCLVMTRLPGAPLARPADEQSWIDQLAGALASIHGVDVNRLSPDYPRAPEPVQLVEERLGYWEPSLLHELWRELADALRSAAPALTPNPAVLTHDDFWFGNTLWSGERLTGIVDWGSARIGDPAFDVAYARGDMQLTLGGGAPDRLLARYEARRGPLHAVPFWDLLSLLPAFRWLDDWVVGYRELGRAEITNELARERLASFIRAALRAL
jgi:aminoglycoside phosphotransferase (APT) family kinase protein